MTETFTPRTGDRVAFYSWALDGDLYGDVTAVYPAARLARVLVDEGDRDGDFLKSFDTLRHVRPEPTVDKFKPGDRVRDMRTGGVVTGTVEGPSGPGAVWVEWNHAPMVTNVYVKDLELIARPEPTETDRQDAADELTRLGQEIGDTATEPTAGDGTYWVRRAIENAQRAAKAETRASSWWETSKTLSRALTFWHREAQCLRGRADEAEALGIALDQMTKRAEKAEAQLNTRSIIAENYKGRAERAERELSTLRNLREAATEEAASAHLAQQECEVWEQAHAEALDRAERLERERDEATERAATNARRLENEREFLAAELRSVRRASQEHANGLLFRAEKAEEELDELKDRLRDLIEEN